MDIILRPVKVKISYDQTLQKITGTPFEKAMVSKNLIFVQFLHFIFSSYPKIPPNYPPGSIGFTLNGKMPTDYSILEENDEVKFYIPSVISRLEEAVGSPSLSLIKRIAEALNVRLIFRLEPR